MPRQFNVCRAAAALVEAALKPDREVAEAFGVSVRTIEYWRSRLKTDEVLQQEFERMASVKLAQWVGEIPGALDEAIGFIRRAAEVCDPRDPDAVKAMVGAIATLNDVLIVQQAMEQRLRD